MSEQPPKANPDYSWLGFRRTPFPEHISERAASAAPHPRESSPQPSRQILADLTARERTILGWGGTLLGLGAGSCLAFAIYVFEKANPLQPVINDQGYNSNNYPNMALTVFLVLVFSLAAGLGLAALAAGLIVTRKAQAPVDRSGPADSGGATGDPA